MKELSSILWPRRITPPEEIGMIPFHLVYSGDVVVFAKIGMSFTRIITYNEYNTEK